MTTVVTTFKNPNFFIRMEAVNEEFSIQKIHRKIWLTGYYVHRKKPQNNAGDRTYFSVIDSF